MSDYTPSIGEILLFKISPDTSRPLLVTHVSTKMTMDREEPVVWGELFLRVDTDASAPWICANAFYRPTKEARSMEIRSALGGDSVGNWRPLNGWPLPPGSAIMDFVEPQLSKETN